MSAPEQGVSEDAVDALLDHFDETVGTLEFVRARDLTATLDIDAHQIGRALRYLAEQDGHIIAVSAWSDNDNASIWQVERIDGGDQ